MKKFMITGVILLIIMSSPASSKEDAAYVEIDAGIIKAEDTVGELNNMPNAGVLNNRAGYDIGGVVGYDFGPIRLEGEASFRRVSNDVLNLLGTQIARPALNGDVRAFSVMGNALVDFGPDQGVQGYFGGGAGVARVHYRIGVPAAVLDDSDSVFAWQVIAGLRTPVSEHVDVGVKYRYFVPDRVSLLTTTGDSDRGNFRSHSIMLTVGYNFGGSEKRSDTE